jgi:2-methylcitrate dehydratase PrpD
LRDSTVLNLAKKITWEADPNSGFPASYSGEIRVTVKNGQQLSHREQVNRGAPERPLAESDVTRKYFENMAVATSQRKAERVARTILAADQTDARELSELLRCT